MKTLYRLRPKVGLMNDFYVFDTETGIKNKDGSIQWHLHGRPESFRFGVIYGFNFCRIIYTIEEFKKELLHERYKNKKVFAHNAEYDLNVLYDNIYMMDPAAIFDGKFICATNGNCLFADSTNIFGKIKLEHVGRMLGIKKPGLGNELLFSANGIDRDEVKRCVTDCEIVYEGLFSIFQSAGDIKITQASLSMTYFRRYHQPIDISYNKLTKNFFHSYYGGRTEAFKIGKTHASVIDVNSMYPYAMRVCKFPNPRYFKEEINPNIQYFLQQILYNYEGLLFASINHRTGNYGYLPYKYKDKTGEKLLFPVGRFTGCWNFNEFRFAFESGVIEIENIQKIVYAPAMDSPFTQYVDVLYAERMKADRDKNEFEKYRVKIFMNSLYGKFAQRISEDRLYVDDINKHYEYIRECQANGTLKKIVMFNADRNDAFLILHSKRGIEVSFSIPSFASYITSFCRVLLLKKIIELDSRGVVYCDTDSIFFENPVGVESEKELGGWKLEEKLVTEIHGLKNYKYIENEKFKRRLKGVPEKAIEIDANLYEFTSLMKTKEGLRRKIDPGILVKRIKKISGEYTKRIVNNDGTTKPIIII